MEKPTIARSAPTRQRLRRDFPGQELILDILREADTLRERQRLLDMRLQYLLESGLDSDCCEGDEAVDVVALRELREGWNDFLRAGGVTAADLQAFVRGDARPPVKLKRHLRVIASNERPRKRLRLSRSDGPEAA
jgi:hypothetical protein